MNKLGYTDDTTVMGESEEKLLSEELLDESERGE